MTTFDVINPATGASIGAAPDANADDARAAIERSVAAFPLWKAKTAFERGDILRRWRDLILKNEDAIARLMTSEMGKPITESRGEVKYAAGLRRLVRRRRQARLRRHHPDPCRRQATARHAPAGRAGLRGDAVELSRGHGHAQGRAGAGRRLHGGVEAGRAVAAHRAAPGRAVGRGRWPRGRVPGVDDRPIQSRSPSRSSPTRACAS